MHNLIVPNHSILNEVKHNCEYLLLCGSIMILFFIKDTVFVTQVIDVFQVELLAAGLVEISSLLNRSSPCIMRYRRCSLVLGIDTQHVSNWTPLRFRHCPWILRTWRIAQSFHAPSFPVLHKRYIMEQVHGRRFWFTGECDVEASLDATLNFKWSRFLAKLW